MDQQQQTQQTEKLIKEMLEFLDDTTSEEEDDPGKLSANESYEKISQHDDIKLVDEVEKDSKTGLAVDSKKDNKLKIKKLTQQYPIWNTREIVSNKKKTLNNQKSPTIWRQSSPSLLGKSSEPAEADISPTHNIDNDWRTKLETNYRSTSNEYIQEVQNAIYGDTTGHPPNGSNDYYQVAQNYAVYGKNFLDFPENLQSIWNDKSTSFTDNTHFTNSQYPIQQGQRVSSANVVGFNNFGKSNSTPSNIVSTSAAAASATSTAAYYQMCNAMQTQTRPTVGNITAGNAATYGLFLGNKITYFAAAPATPSIVYNQHTSSSTSNFVSNSLANAALSTSPAILYSNPVLTTTTQQCLNTFFKETQFLTTGPAAAVNTTQGTAMGTSNAGIYERLIYAQMLQQQFYQQSQQAAAVAAIFQHKQRAAAAVAAARQSVNGGNSNILTVANTATTMSSATPIGTMANTCGRNATMVSNNAATDLLLKQQNSTAITANGNEDISNVLNV